MLCIYLIAVLTVVHSDDDVVAFSKGLVATNDVKGGEIVKFNKDFTSIHTKFSHAAKFIVQTPGIYAFHINSLSERNRQVWLDVFKNRHYLVSLHAYTPNDYADAGNAIILDLKKLDQVFLKAVHANALFGKGNEIYNTFSGELLFPSKAGNHHPIAFSAGLAHTASLTLGAPVLYDKIMANTGNCYNQTTGEFMASVDGLYTIYYHALAETEEKMWLDLYHNDNYINTAYGQGQYTSAYAGNSAILHLHSGDRLSIRSRPEANVVLKGTPTEVYSTFSAALLSSTIHGVSGTVHAFSVGLSRDLDSTGSHKVIFDRVFTNQGGEFNVVTGVFTARVHGIYVFHYHSLSDLDSSIWLELYHNDHYVNSLFGHTSHGWTGGSNTATLQLAVHDTVYININHNTHTIVGASSEIYTTFSGYLLAPMTS